ncbi:hypothetical protein BD410DRAFT_786373 [Rickenella mellea]|uniref:Autophagy-related protein 27 n=1 Tax=Rickenella mellea TaxID=50990 RepID=A0A4Y7QAF8_9AGAM|nr:hypothetical protein BD410DRAFT_786373 [Rickenella mellea]
MVKRQSLLLCSLCCLPLAFAQDSPFDCHVSLDGGARKYDLTSLKGEHTASRTRDTPPTTMVDEVRFDLCEDLKPRDGVAAADQCTSNTRACFTKTNKKTEQGDRIVAVIPVARSDGQTTVEVSSLSSPKGLQLIFHGSPYPTTDPQPQTFSVALLCDSTTSSPQFKSYNNSQLSVEWKTPAACEADGKEPPKDGDKEGDGGNGGQEDAHVGSGLGWFFLLLLLAFAAYFALGAYYNYTTYGATGSDLIPHRDFWRDVPYLIRDVVSHLCSSFRPRRTSSRGGYIAV